MKSVSTRVSGRLRERKGRTWPQFGPWAQPWVWSATEQPTPWHLASTHPASHGFTLTLNICSWWSEVDFSFLDIFCLTWHQVCKLQGQFWCQSSGGLKHWLVCLLQGSYLSKVLFLSHIRKSEVFSVAIVVNCDQISNDEILGDFEACESLLTLCSYRSRHAAHHC